MKKSIRQKDTAFSCKDYIEGGNETHSGTNLNWKIVEA